ncbi:MAG: hypothetical protein KY459_02425 [Acidobacteria bacterium]|nr:hypothetical protein [Acidobacteriota bacterium]
MIIHSKSTAPFVKEFATPAEPFHTRTWISPYSLSARSSWHPAIDLYRLEGVAPSRTNVEVASGFDRAGAGALARPVVCDVSGPQERVYSTGRELVAAAAGRNGTGVSLLINPESGLPSSYRSAGEVIVSAWPPWPGEVEELAERLEEMRWHLMIPLAPPLTTDLSMLEKLVRTAEQRGARSVVAVSVDLDTPARRRLAEMSRSEESWMVLFDDDIELLQLASERHVAALALEAGLDWRLPEPTDDGTNWAAASHLARIGTLMVRLEENAELGWLFLRASKVVAGLGHSVRELARGDSLEIVDLLEGVVGETLREWIDQGESSLLHSMSTSWPLRRDYTRD